MLPNINTSYIMIAVIKNGIYQLRYLFTFFKKNKITEY